jgi:hypothetical protein
VRSASAVGTRLWRDSISNQTDLRVEVRNLVTDTSLGNVTVPAYFV